MYHLLVSGNDEGWQGKPFQIEMSRRAREYKSDVLTEKYGSFNADQVNELKRYPCILAF